MLRLKSSLTPLFCSSILLPTSRFHAQNTPSIRPLSTTSPVTTLVQPLHLCTVPATAPDGSSSSTHPTVYSQHSIQNNPSKTQVRPCYPSAESQPGSPHFTEARKAKSPRRSVRCGAQPLPPAPPPLSSPAALPGSLAAHASLPGTGQRQRPACPLWTPLPPGTWRTSSLAPCTLLSTCHRLSKASSDRRISHCSTLPGSPHSA